LSPKLRPLPLVLVLAACGGSSAPPPPVATATPSRTADDLRPMSSREGAAPAVATPAAEAPMAAAPGPVDRNAPLPPGHPPLEGGPASAAALPAGHPPIGEPAPGARSAGAIAGTIALAPKLKANPSDVLYVMAKKGAATLAVKRVDKPSFPLEFEISGGDAMMAGGAFAGTVDVVARLSRTGDAIPAKGDLEGVTRNVKVPSKAVRLTIDTVR
jgi:cytochrome c-type biogenesis protein CcmH